MLNFIIGDKYIKLMANHVSPISITNFQKVQISRRFDNTHLYIVDKISTTHMVGRYFLSSLPPIAIKFFNAYIFYF